MASCRTALLEPDVPEAAVELLSEPAEADASVADAADAAEPVLPAAPQPNTEKLIVTVSRTLSTLADLPTARFHLFIIFAPLPRGRMCLALKHLFPKIDRYA
jgi:hypothetical protein